MVLGMPPEVHFKVERFPIQDYGNWCPVTFSAQVWDSSLADLLYVWKIPPRTESPEAIHLDFVRGVAFNVPASGEIQLCAGCSSGDVQVSLSPH